MNVQFLNSVFDESIENPNFFNGRVLTAQDLRDVQTASRIRTNRLGQALGAGIAYGLTVASSGTALDIAAGLAVNQRGDPLLLSANISLPLTATEQAVATLDSPFAPCDLDSRLLVTPVVDAEFLLLIITPATRFSTTQATSSDLNGGARICTSRYEEEGIQFKLVPLNDVFDPIGDEARWRSRLANDCFGTQALQAQATAPFQTRTRYGIVDDLRLAGALADCDVPLAVLRWHSGSVQFVDMWAVRRPYYQVLDASTVAPSAVGHQPFAQHSSPRRAIEAQARLLQFQEQIEQLRLALSSPQTTEAATHFTHLPSVGYLRLSSDTPGTDGKGFQIAQFFQEAITPQSLDSAFLRSLMHQSFYVEPLVVEAETALPIDLYTVTGANSQRPYIVFARRQPLVVVESPEEPEEPPAPVRTGQLFVTVTDVKGTVLTTRQVATVTATTTDGLGIPYVGQLLTGVGGFGKDVSFGAKSASQIFLENALRSGSAETGTFDVKGIFDDEQLAIYYFPTLPVGSYTVAAKPTRLSGLRANSAVKSVRASTENTLSLALVRQSGKGPSIAIPEEDPWTLIGGPIDRVYVDPWWKELLEDPRHVIIDPDDWVTDPPPPEELLDLVKDRVSVVIQDEPHIALEGATILVRPDYDPAETYAEPYAYLGTADGTYFPLVLVPSDHALAGDVPATRGGIADIDDVTYNTGLSDYSLQNLEALTGAWGGLLSAAFNVDAVAAVGLIEETRGSAQNLQTSFTRYPGIDGAANTALQEAGFTDDVALANADAQAVLDALGEGFTIGFATRLVDRARNATAPTSWSLDNLGFSDDELSALAGLGVQTKGDLATFSESAEGRSMLRDTLNVDEAGLVRLEEDALSGIIGSRVLGGRQPNLSGVRGVTDDIARQLVNTGYKTANDLATADRNTLATALDISLEEAGELVRNATEVSGGFTVIASNLGLSADNITALQTGGIVSMGDLASASPETLGTLLDNAALGSRLSNISQNVFGPRG